MPPVEIQEFPCQTRDNSQQTEDTTKPNKVSQRSSAIPSNGNGNAEKSLQADPVAGTAPGTWGW